MLPCFPALPALYRNTWPAFGFWGGAVMQVSGGFCKIPRTSVIVREGCTKRTPSDPSSITATCQLNCIDTSNNCISRASTSMRIDTVILRSGASRDGTGYPGAVSSRPVPGFSNDRSVWWLCVQACSLISRQW